MVRDCIRYTGNSDGAKFDIKLVDFDGAEWNIYRAVNQPEVGYGTQDNVRFPDMQLYVNRIPLCIFELKNPTKDYATIADAYEQIHTRYLHDIPHCCVARRYPPEWNEEVFGQVLGQV